MAAAGGKEQQPKEGAGVKAKAVEAEPGGAPVSPSSTSTKSAEQQLGEEGEEEEEEGGEEGGGGGKHEAEGEAEGEEAGSRAEADYGGGGGGDGGRRRGGMRGRGGGAGRGGGPRRPFVSTGHASDAPIAGEGPVRIQCAMPFLCRRCCRRWLTTIHILKPTQHTNPPKQARFFVIKSFSPSDVVASVRHRLWASTEPGNARLDRCVSCLHTYEGLFTSTNHPTINTHCKPQPPHTAPTARRPRAASPCTSSSRSTSRGASAASP